jgi:hypothetical protein
LAAFDREHQAARGDLNHNNERKHIMTATSPTPTRPSRYRYPVPYSTDGCDEIYEVYTRDSQRCIAWCGFWDERAKHRQSVGKVAAFLEAVANEEITLDLGALIEELKSIAAQWGWNELRQARPDLSDVDCWDIIAAYHVGQYVFDTPTFSESLTKAAEQWFLDRAGNRTKRPLLIHTSEFDL